MREPRSIRSGNPAFTPDLNHMLVEAVELGALAHFKVEGKWNDDLMKQVLVRLGRPCN